MEDLLVLKSATPFTVSLSEDCSVKSSPLKADVWERLPSAHPERRYAMFSSKQRRSSLLSKQAGSIQQRCCDEKVLHMPQSVEDAAAYVFKVGQRAYWLSRTLSAYCNVPGAPRRFPPARYLLAGEDSCGHLSAIWPFAFVPESAMHTFHGVCQRIAV